MSGALHELIEDNARKIVEIARLQERIKKLEASLFCEKCVDGKIWDDTETVEAPWGEIVPCPTCGKLREKLRGEG